jgi:polyhydroxybutyrate depolymerase
MRRATWVIVVLVLLGAAACASDGESGGGPGTGDGSTPPPADAGGSAEATAGGCDPAAEAEPGQTLETVQSGGATREYRLDIPAGYDGTTQVPLFFNLHGFGGSADRQDEYTALDEAAAEVDGIVVTPQGVGGAFFFDPESADLVFLSELITDLQERLCIDPTRVAVAGISNGAALSATAACVLSDQLSAVGLVAATVPPLGCTPDTRTSVIAFHGTADSAALYEGSAEDNLLPAEEGIAAWAAQDGCAGEPAIEDVAPDVQHWTWSGCQDGTAVEFYPVEGVGHVWPGAALVPRDDGQPPTPNTDSISASELIVQFVVDHPRPA